MQYFFIIDNAKGICYTNCTKWSIIQKTVESQYGVGWSTLKLKTIEDGIFFCEGSNIVMLTDSTGPEVNTSRL